MQPSQQMAAIGPIRDIKELASRTRASVKSPNRSEDQISSINAPIRPKSSLGPNRRNASQISPHPCSLVRSHSPSLSPRSLSSTTFQPFSMSLKRTFSISSKKDAPVANMDAIKASISGPHSLKYGAEQMQARIGTHDARRGHSRSRSQVNLVGSLERPASPIAQMNRRGSKGQSTMSKLLKRPPKVTFAAAEKRKSFDHV
jgi:hypothetical protein